MEEDWTVELLSDKARADILAVDLNQTPVGLRGKESLSQTCYDKWKYEPTQDKRDYGQSYRWPVFSLKLFLDVKLQSCYTSDIAMSISLIPTNGTMTPPTP